MIHLSRENPMLAIDDVPTECVRDCSAQGSVDDAVAHWRAELDFTVEREQAITGLLSYGAWDRAELEAATDDALAERVLWLACGDFNEWDGTDDSPCGSPIFCLEG